MNFKKAGQALVERIAKIKRLYLLLDFDGTLTPIVSRPSQVKLLPKAKAILRKLSRMSGVKVAIISGRLLSDLEKRVRVSGVNYIGNHGLERRIRGVVDIDPYAIKFRGFVVQLVSELRRALQGLPGVLVEDKLYGVSVHYRNVAPKNIGRARRIFQSTWSNFTAGIFFRVKPGKKVWEARLAYGNSDKGKAVKALLGSVPEAAGGIWKTVYIGDDRTDEDAFKVLKKTDFAIRVGYDRCSRASYWLRSPDEVLDFLEQLIKARKRTGSPHV